jgi:hypothetical protein
VAPGLGIRVCLSHKMSGEGNLKRYSRQLLTGYAGVSTSQNNMLF